MTKNRDKIVNRDISKKKKSDIFAISPSFFFFKMKSSSAERDEFSVVA